ncbi:MAG: hypothetical protein KKB50_11250 [Planctomycetes bacterium]|nr:hypothetical protein [Planctomycetota bacterium]
MAKIKIEKGLYDRVAEVAKRAGYSSADEFITHMLEKEVAQLEEADTDEQLEERLRGLGYIE